MDSRQQILRYANAVGKQAQCIPTPLGRRVRIAFVYKGQFMQMILPREACAGDKRVLRREHMHRLPVC